MQRDPAALHLCIIVTHYPRDIPHPLFPLRLLHHFLKSNPYNQLTPLTPIHSQITVVNDRSNLPCKYEIEITTRFPAMYVNKRESKYREQCFFNRKKVSSSRILLSKKKRIIIDLLYSKDALQFLMNFAATKRLPLFIPWKKEEIPRTTCTRWRETTRFD